MKTLRSLTIALALAAPTLPAAAADFPVEPVYARPAVVIFRWTGVYLGVHVGGGRGFVDENAVPLTGNPGTPGVFTPFSQIVPLPTSIGSGGWLAGGQIGGNYQIESWVIGIEADASWASFNGSSTCAANLGPPPVTALTASCTTKLDSLGTAAVRLGWAFDHLLLYGKGGAAWTNNSHQVTFNIPAGLTTAGGVPLPAGLLLMSTNELRWGWMAGIGVEWAFTDNWSAKIEYNYMDLGADALQFTEKTGLVYMNANLRERLNVVKLGVNYRFGPPALLIK
jgi:outer membrane immunogenic protein